MVTAWWEALLRLRWIAMMIAHPLEHNGMIKIGSPQVNNDPGNKMKRECY